MVLLQTAVVEPVVEQLDGAAEQGVENVLVGQAGGVPPAGEPVHGRPEQAAPLSDAVQVHEQDAGVDVGGGVPAVQAHAKGFGGEAAKSPSGVVQCAGETVPVQAYLPELPQVQVHQGVAVQVDDPADGKQVGDEKAVERPNGTGVLNEGHRPSVQLVSIGGDVDEADLLRVLRGRAKELSAGLLRQRAVVQHVYDDGALRVLEDGGHHDARVLAVRPPGVVQR